MNQNSKDTQVNPETAPKQRTPNDKGSISVEAHVRIFDPATKKIFVEQRA